MTESDLIEPYTYTYNTTATAVSRIDNLEFLADVIPKTTTYKQFKESRADESIKTSSNNTTTAVREKGQRTLNGTLAVQQHKPSNKPTTESGQSKESSQGGPAVPLSALINDSGPSAGPSDEDVEMVD